MKMRNVANFILMATTVLVAQTIVPIEPIGTIVTPAYPRVDVTPRTPVAGDEVQVKLVLGTACCNPNYATSSNIVHHQITCVTTPCPQQYEVELTYSVSGPCACIAIYPAPTVETGPSFNLGILNAGIYTVVDDDDTVGAFEVYEYADSVKGHKLSGVVMTDPSPAKIASMPISGAKVYLRRTVEYWYMTNQLVVDDALVTIAPTPIYRIVDSATTGTDGVFKFNGLLTDNYEVTASADGYQAGSVSLHVESDKNVTLALVGEDAKASLAGTVTDMDGGLVAQCSVSVMFSDCWSIVPIDPYIVLDTNVAYLEGGAQSQTTVVDPSYAPCRVYSAVTDSNGEYSIQDIALNKNGQPITVTARKSGYATASKRAELNNMIETTVDIVLERKFGNIDSTLDGDVSYVVRTEKSVYNQGELLAIQYTVYNNGSSAVTFDGLSSSCKFDYVLTDGAGAQVYHLLSNVACTQDLAQLTIAAGDSASAAFTAYYLGGTYNELTITAQVAGHNDTKASVKVAVDQPAAFVERSSKPAVRDVVRVSDAQVTVNLTRSQVVSMDVYTLNGRHKTRILSSQMLNSGRHAFSLPKATGVSLVRVSGEDFVVTEKVGMVRR